MSRLSIVALTLAVAVPVAAADLEEIEATQKKILERLDSQDALLRQILEQTKARPRVAAAPADEPHEIPVAQSDWKGAENAKVTVVGFSDFQCPFCAREAELPDRLLDAFPKDVRFVFKHFPLTQIHPHAMPAARAAVAAGKQGKFWEMHDALFANYNRLSPERIRELGGEVGLDMKKFEADLEDAATTKLVEADLELGRKIGVRGTPTFFLNGKRVTNRSLEALKGQIEAELGK